MVPVPIDKVGLMFKTRNWTKNSTKITNPQAGGYFGTDR